MSIRISEKYGLNAALTVCKRCGKDTNEIALLGKAFEYECGFCHKLALGRPQGACPHCNHSDWIRKGEFDGRNKKVLGGLCSECLALEELTAEMVKEGGIYWKCDDCHCEGAIGKEHSLSKMVREYAGIAAPDPCGVEFTKKDCPSCGPQEKKDDGEMTVHLERG